MGNFNFTPFNIPDTKTGRWLVMDVGDIDGDGNPDIVLGNCTYGSTLDKTAYTLRKGPPFMVLKNMGS